MTANPLPVTTQRVRELYTRFPYPPVGTTEGTTPIPASLDFTRHVFWPGRSDLAGLRVLDAGCGTGRTAVTIASDHPEVDVVGIDLSETSLERARAHARALGVGTNLEFHALPIEDIAVLDRPFDYIIASGVIHHLASPERGLQALADVLVPTGGIFLMVYATYGRAGVYQLQHALRMLGAGADYPELLALARPLLKHLPADHPFNAFDWHDAASPDDAGIVDLLLHVRDRPYTVPQLFELLAAAGLHLSRFMDRTAYEPSIYVQAPEVVARGAHLDAAARAEVAELLSGRMIKHQVYATHADYAPLRPAPVGQVLLLLRPRRSPLFNWSAVQTLGDRSHQQFRLTECQFSEAHTREYDFAPWQFSIAAACDGVRTALEVFRLPHLQAMIPGDDADTRLQHFGQLLEVLAEGEVILCDF